MIVRYSDPDLAEDYETEVPCDADPLPFAEELVRRAYREDPKAPAELARLGGPLDDGLVRDFARTWASADGSRIAP